MAWFRVVVMLFALGTAASRPLLASSDLETDAAASTEGAKPQEGAAEPKDALRSCLDRVLGSRLIDGVLRMAFATTPEVKVEPAKPPADVLIAKAQTASTALEKVYAGPATSILSCEHLLAAENSRECVSCMQEKKVWGHWDRAMSTALCPRTYSSYNANAGSSRGSMG